MCYYSDSPFTDEDSFVTIAVAASRVVERLEKEMADATRYNATSAKVGAGEGVATAPGNVLQFRFTGRQSIRGENRPAMPMPRARRW